MYAPVIRYLLSIYTHIYTNMHVHNILCRCVYIIFSLIRCTLYIYTRGNFILSKTHSRRRLACIHYGDDKMHPSSGHEILDYIINDKRILSLLKYTKTCVFVHKPSLSQASSVYRRTISAHHIDGLNIQFLNELYYIQVYCIKHATFKRHNTYIIKSKTVIFRTKP
jgi:hypothetical protein